MIPRPIKRGPFKSGPFPRTRLSPRAVKGPSLLPLSPVKRARKKARRRVARAAALGAVLTARRAAKVIGKTALRAARPR